MTRLVEKTEDVQKTFTIPNYIADELEEYARDYDIKQSQIVADAIEQYIEKQTESKKSLKDLMR
ncbi:MAG: ribbon-helix-helix domain-containing protein [Campylobacterales bacterium]